MKKKFTILITAALMLLTMMASTGTMWGQAAVNTTLWEETWTGGTANTTPSSYNFSGTTVYGGATLTYAQSSTNTKLYAEELAGGTSPELLLSKSNQTWTISNIPTGQATEMSLTFLSNKNTFTVTSSTTGITISGGQKSWTISANSGITNFDLTIKNTGSSNARIDNILLKVTTAGTGGGSTVTATTVTIDDSNLTNTDLYQGTNAGALTATVTENANNTTIANATVAWSSTNESVATIDQDGNVTLVAVGNATLKATYAGLENTYGSSSANYQITVTNSDPNVPGTENNPYTVAQARAAIDAGTGVTGVYATGIVSEIPTAWSTTYNNITFNFVDNSGDTDFLQAYRCGSGTGVDASEVAVGDIVVVYGNLTKYGSTYEFGQGCSVVSLEHPVITDPSITIEPQSFDLGTTNQVGVEITRTFTVSQANLADDITLTLTGDGALSEDVIDQGSGPYDITWSYTPATAGTINATITATCGTTTATLTITGEANATHSVTYHANVDGQANIVENYNAGTNVTVAYNTFTNPGYAFTSWNTNQNGGGTSYAPGAVIENISADYDLWAQWEQSNEATDVLNWAATGSPTNYTDWTYTAPSGTGYAGQSSGTYQSIQLRTTNNNSGIVTTSSVGNATKIKVTWNSNTANGRTLNIYGKNTAYTAATDLYGDDAGDLIGTIVYGTGTTELNITGVYAYIGMRSASSAMYLDEINITWNTSGIIPPSITANNVEIDYNATNGSIAYTINNEPDPAGDLTANTTETWLTIGTPANGTVPFTCSANETTAARTATVTLTYTYGNNETATKDVTVTQTAAPVVYSTIPDLFAAATSTAANVTVAFNDWVVSGVSTNGKNVFVTDGTNGFVIYSSTSMINTYSVGNILQGTISCSLKLNNGYAQLTDVDGLTINDGGTVTVAAIEMANLAGINTGALVHYENLTCSVENNKYYLSDGTTTLQVYSSLYTFSALESGKSYNITGIYQQYGETKEVLPRSADDIEEVASTTPSVTVTPSTINAPFGGTDGTIAITYENIPGLTDFDYHFCDAEGNELLDTDPAYPGDWIYAEINENNGAYSLDYIIDANDGDARTAYLFVFYESYSAIVTVNQAAYVAPSYAELPFSFNGGRADIEGTDGLTQEGLGTDYNATSNPTTKLKFDGTGDWLLLQFNERPGTLTFDIKGNSFSGGTFTVQTSEDGATYTDLETYTDLGDTQSESFNTLGENVRYIKWIYTEKSNGNVGLGNIALAAYAEPAASITVANGNANIDVNATGVDNATLAIAYENLTITDQGDFDIQYYNENGDELGKDDQPDWMEASIQVNTTQDGYEVSYSVDPNDGAARTAYFKVYALDNNSELVYSNLITINQAAYVAPVATITVADGNANIDVDVNGVENATLAIAYENLTITENTDFDIQYYNENGDELGKDDEPIWMAASIQENSTQDGYEVSYDVFENTGAARTAYFKVFAMGDQDFVYSNLVTINQAAYVVDYATLPFEWAGGTTANFNALNGTSTNSVGDYGDNQGVYRMKLDGTGDYIQVKTNEQPGIVTIGVKMIGGASTSTISVQGSANGETFTNIQELTISGAQNDILTLTTTNSFTADDRYVRLLFNKGSNVGVGPITIAQVDLTPSITLNSYSIETTSASEISALTATYNNINEVLADVEYYESDGTTVTTYDWFEAEVNSTDNSVIDYVIEENDGNARTAYFKVYALVGSEYVYSDLVTVTQSAYIPPVPTTSYSLVTDATQIVSGMHYIITNGTDKAMGVQNSNNRAAVAITIENDAATIAEDAGVYELVINGPDANGNYTIYDKQNPGYLYAASSGSNHLKTRTDNSDANSQWSIVFDAAGNVVITAQGSNTRNLMRYNSSSTCFSCYAATNSQQDIYLYVKDNDNDFEYYGLEIAYTEPTIPAGETITVGAGSVMTVDPAFTNTNPANLIIEDGGQLIHDNPVSATIQMDVTGYGRSNPNGYKLIASPVEGNLDVETETNLLDGTYDLYIFDQDQPSEEWRNYKAGEFTSIDNEKGYLYANANNITITFAGELRPSNYDVTMDLDYTNGNRFAGLNLVGNPFACNAYIKDASNTEMAFYRMNGNGDGFIPATGAIKPMEGIFVQATESDQSFKFTKEAPSGNAGKGNLNLHVAQTVTGRNAQSVADNAIIRFDGGNTLEKFNFREGNTQVYIPQGNKDYAVVRSEAQGEMPVNFKAAENGTYTINFSKDNVEFGYLHLIDNMTGTEVDLLQTPSYTFEANTNDNANRFRLQFSAHSVNEYNIANDFAFISNGNLMIPGIEGEATLQMIDVTGRILSSEQFSGSYNKAVNAAKGVYMLRLIQGENAKTQKIVVK